MILGKIAILASRMDTNKLGGVISPLNGLATPKRGLVTDYTWTNHSKWPIFAPETACA
jgi:hypothetical protein